MPKFIVKQLFSTQSGGLVSFAGMSNSATSAVSSMGRWGVSINQRIIFTTNQTSKQLSEHSYHTNDNICQARFWQLQGSLWERRWYCRQRTKQWVSDVFFIPAISICDKPAYHGIVDGNFHKYICSRQSGYQRLPSREPSCPEVYICSAKEIRNHLLLFFPL